MNRKNSFDLIRHFAAVLVLFSHHYALSKLPEPVFLHWDTYGTVAVVIFFCVSGYFMPASFNNSNSFMHYMRKRCYRIFPGLVVCSFFMCYLIGSFFTSESVFVYLFSPSTLQNSLMYSIFFRPKIADVFSDFLYSGAVNGSLWTLPIEFSFYIVLGMALTIKNTWQFILTGLVSSIIISLTVTHFSDEYPVIAALHLHYVALFAVAFSGGSLMSMTHKYWFSYRFYLMSIAFASLALSNSPVLIAISLTILTITLGVSITDKVINGRFDISYGIYIYAFPIQQIIINRVTQDFWTGLILATFFTCFAAFLSYHFVEKPFLSLKNRANTALFPSLR